MHAIATSAGIISPLVTGWLIDHAAIPLTGYIQAYLLSAGLLCATGILGAFLITPSITKQKLLMS